MTDKTNDNVRV